MSEIKRIVDQMQRAYAGEAWHGPALHELLEGLSAEQALSRPFPHVHSIWELVVHLTVWKSIVRRRLLGEVVAAVPPHEDWPPVHDPSASAWAAAQQKLLEAHRDLLTAVALSPETRLNETVPGQTISIYVMLHGVIQHDLYHAGQIAILRRALA